MKGKKCLTDTFVFKHSSTLHQLLDEIVLLKYVEV